MKNLKALCCFMAMILLSNSVYATQHEVISTKIVKPAQTYQNYSQDFSKAEKEEFMRLQEKTWDDTITEEEFARMQELIFKASSGVFLVEEKGNLTISPDTVFLNNKASGVGGVIASLGNVVIGNGSIFESNKSDINGGVLENSNVAYIGDNVKFLNNKAAMQGGVVDNTGNLYIGKNVEFRGNNGGCDGGAIANYNGNVIIDENALFEGNINYIAEKDREADVEPDMYRARGGALLNMDVYEDIQKPEITILNGARFINNKSNNTSEDLGGAIYNDNGIINLIADTYNVEFTGNKAGNNVSNAIHDDCGTINLWASDRASIIFNDRITSESFGGSTLNINKSSGTLPTTGKIELNEDMSGYTGRINLYGGELKVGEKGKLFGKNSVLNLEGGTLNLNNNKIDNIANSFILSADSNLMIDVNLATDQSDQIKFLNASGKLNISEVNILGDSSEDIGSIKVAEEADVTASAVSIGENKSYIFKASSTKGSLDYEKKDVGGFNAIFGTDAITTDSNAELKYSPLNNAKIGADLGIFKGKQLTISGNDNSVNIDGNGHAGIEVSGNQILNIKDISEFKNFKSENGGAIYNIGGTVEITADKNNVEFSGNEANSKSNAIHDEGGTINLLTSNNANIVFDDRITSKDSASTLNISQISSGNNENVSKVGKSSDILSEKGKVILNEDMSGYTGTVNLYSGIIKLGEQGKLFGGNMTVADATIDTANKILQKYNFKNLTVTNSLNMIVDTDLKNEKMDTISAENYSGTGKINVAKFNILEDAEKNETEINFTESDVLKDKITSAGTASSELYKYNVEYNANTGNFLFVKTMENNPTVLEGAVASAAGGSLTQAIVLNQAFANIDTNNSNNKRSAKKYGALYAGTVNRIYESDNKIERGLWIRPYMMQETIKLDNFDVDNTSYGTLAGLDFAVDEDKMVSVYIGYAGSEQKYEGIKTEQTGYMIGASGMLIKDKYFAGITANVGFNDISAKNDYGTDEFKMNMYSIGAKAGYDIEAGEKWIIQPGLMLMYGTIGTDEYTTSQGAKVESGNTVNIHIEPQIKAKLSLNNGWAPYGLVSYAINAGEKTKAKVENDEIESGNIDGYIEYGIGTEKDFNGTPWSINGQVTGRNGGRNGFAFNLGVKYAF